MTLQVRDILPGCEFIADIYVRVSTDEQIGDDKTSIPDQIAYVRANLSRLGFREGRVWQEVHSASTRHRPQLNAAMERVRRGEVGALIVAKADRFIRNPIGLMVLMEDIKALNVGLIACLERIDSRDPYGVEIWQTLIKAAEMYRANFFDNSSNAKLSMAKRGVLPNAAGSGRMYGYVYDRNTKRFAIDPATAPWVVKIFRWSNEHLSNYTITRMLTEKDAPAPGGKQWHPEAVRRILTNRAYVGEYEAYRERPAPHALRNFPMSRWAEHWSNPEAKPLPIPDAFPAILDTPELRALAEGYAGRAARQKRTSARNAKHDYFLRGLLRCDVCGWGYAGVTRNRIRGGEPFAYRYYHCNNPDCANHTIIDMDEADAEAWQHIVNLVANPDILDRIMAATRSDTRAQEVEADIDRLTRARVAIEAEASRNLDLIAHGDLEDWEIADRRAKRERLRVQRQAIVEELEAVQAERGRLAISDDLERAVRQAAHAVSDDVQRVDDVAWKRWVLDGLQADFLVHATPEAGRSRLQLRIGGVDVMPLVTRDCSTPCYNVYNAADLHRLLAPFRALPRITVPTTDAA
jgi:DNA invertase Pin-like site-specific DNA recombinase